MIHDNLHEDFSEPPPPSCPFKVDEDSHPTSLISKVAVGSYGLYEIPRSTDLPLRFEGTLIGEGSSLLTALPGTCVTIWKTRKGSYITHVHQYRLENGKFSSIFRAEVHEQGSDALEWLKQDSPHGNLGSVSLKAWVSAGLHDPSLEGLQYEYVE